MKPIVITSRNFDAIFLAARSLFGPNVQLCNDNTVRIFGTTATYAIYRNRQGYQFKRI